MAKVPRPDKDGKEYTISVTSGASIGPKAKSEPNTEFTKFADLTRKLTQVPKQELDEKRKA